MPRVFISYRRQDSKWPARSLSDQLKAHFGPDNVFMDIDTLQPGEDFVEVIENAVGTCDALIALIGPQWLTITDSAGRQRLQNPNDFIRLEIATALRRNIRVIPVMIDGATMPAADELPADLAALVRRHALDLSEKRFHHDTQMLIATLQKVIGQAPPSPERPPPPASDVLPCDLALAIPGSPPAVLLKKDSKLPATARTTLPAPCDYELLAIGVGSAPVTLARLQVGARRPATLPPSAAPSKRIIGIDLGTTNSVVSVMEGSSVRVIANSEGSTLTPSVVAFRADRTVLVGEPARRQAVANPSQTIYSIKRFTGCRGVEVEEDRQRMPFPLRGGPSEFVRVDVGGREMMPQEISAHVLAVLKRQAEAALGEPAPWAVITVPAYFNDSQRQATLDAARIAGFEIDWAIEDPGSKKIFKQQMRIINEPTAAALAYGLQRKVEGKVAVYDLGGGTFDISILDIGDGVYEVKATNGDTHLGGDDFDSLLIDHLAKTFRTETGIDLRKDAVAMTRLREAAESAKRHLSEVAETEIILPFICNDAAGPKHFRSTITRDQFERMIEPLVRRTIECCERALKDAGYNPTHIESVLLVGGSTRVPAVRNAVKKLFGREPRADLNPDEVVSIGAAVQGACLLAASRSDMLLLDVTPMSLGIETLGGVFTTLIGRNTTIPKRAVQVFKTTADNQAKVRIHVLQGDRTLAMDNRTLGEFLLEEIPPGPAGTQKIEVAFDIDYNGILRVAAKNQSTGLEQSIRVNARAGLGDEELNRLRVRVEDAALPTPATAAPTLVDLTLQADIKGWVTVTALDRATGQAEQLATVDLSRGRGV